VKFDGTNYGLWSQSVELYVKSQEKLKHLKGEKEFETWEHIPGANSEFTVAAPADGMMENSESCFVRA
jgi:hypothetical protein